MCYGQATGNFCMIIRTFFVEILFFFLYETCHCNTTRIIFEDYLKAVTTCMPYIGVSYLYKESIWIGTLNFLTGSACVSAYLSLATDHVPYSWHCPCGNPCFRFFSTCAAFVVILCACVINPEQNRLCSEPHTLTIVNNDQC